MKKYFCIVLGISLTICVNLVAQSKNLMNEKNPLGQQGTISFVLQTDKNYHNGQNEGEFEQTLLELPGLAKCLLQKSGYGVFLILEWEKKSIHNGFYVLLTDLPGPERYAVQFTWDGDKGVSNGYINGIPFRTEKEDFYKPWDVKGSATMFGTPVGPNKVTDVQIFSRNFSEDQLKELIPKSLVGKQIHLFFAQSLSAPLDIKNRKGELLYSSPLDTKNSVKDWILVGPGEIAFENDKMIMSSRIPNPPDGSTGHFNFWCPANFPENIVIEWEFQPLSDQGVCHMFFAAQGRNDEDIFNPVLPLRDGHFQQYINGAIKNYYIIYFSNRRLFRTTNFATTWLMKSANASLLTLGKIAVSPENKNFHRMRLIKDGGHIQLLANDRIYLDYTDPGNKRSGLILEEGKISFRQMAVTKAAYRNFKVWELK